MDILTFLTEGMKPAKRLITIYRDEDSSEVDWEGESLVKAMKQKATPDAEIIQGGWNLAVAKGRRWKLTRVGEKVLKMEKAGEDFLHPPKGTWGPTR